MNPIVQFAASALPGERRYLLVVGAGVSKDAGLPTAWDVMLETAKLLYSAESEGAPSREELERWFVASPYAGLSYSDVIGRLYTTYPEQQTFLQGLLWGKPLGEAHRLVAELARRGIIRAVITTNFDDYIERALEVAALPYQVISTDEDLLNSEPLIHCKATRIYKPHGTLGKGVLRNTPEDLKSLAPAMTEELTRVLGEHGVVVLGYSGSDPGMFDVLRRRRRNLYPLFWVDPVRPPQSVLEFLECSGASYIPCRGAATFLRDYFDLLDRLAQITPTDATGPRLHELEAALKSGSPATGPLFGDYVSGIRSALERLRPDFKSAAEYDEAIIRQIEKGAEAVLQFAEAAGLAARYGDQAAALALYKSFSSLSQLCELPEGFSGSFRKTDFDGFKFLVYEMLVLLAAELIRTDRWDLLGQVLAEDLFVERQRQSKYVHYSDLRLFAPTLDQLRNIRLNLNRLSVTSDLVNARTTTGPLAKVLSARAFMDADYLLYLRSALLEEREDPTEGISLCDVWIPWSCLYLSHTPPYLKRAQSTRFLSLLSHACGVTEQGFKQRIGGRLNKWVKFFSGGWPPDGITDFDPAELGTRP